MFLLPFSLFVITAYLRPRTQGELSYLLTAIECLSGLWCLLFAPFLVQFVLFGLLCSRNAERLSKIFARSAPRPNDFHDLSDPFIPTIDIAARSIQHVQVATDSLPAIRPQNFAVKTGEAKPSFSAISSSANVLVLPTADLRKRNRVEPALIEKTTPSDLSTQTPAETQLTPLAGQTQLVKMQYRGTTYLKRIPVIPATTSYSGQYRGVTTHIAG